MTRLERFRALEHHPWLGKGYKKLKADELQTAFDLLAKAEDMSKDEYSVMVVRLWMDKPKPKNWATMEELLIASI